MPRMAIQECNRMLLASDIHVPLLTFSCGLWDGEGTAQESNTRRTSIWQIPLTPRQDLSEMRGSKAKA